MNEERNCRFCKVSPAEIVYAGRHTFAFRDELPVAPGHTLVIPTRHVKCVFDLDDLEYREIWESVKVVRAQLASTYSADGFTIGVNNGDAAGQTVDHAHVHVIPRHWGDVRQPRGGIRAILAVGNGRNDGIATPPAVGTRWRT